MVVVKGLRNLAIAVAVFMLLVWSIGQLFTGVEPARAASPETRAQPAPSTAPPLPSAAPESRPMYPTKVDRTPTGEQAQVSKVVDGDTLELTDGRKVRVLGVDSCEMNTAGGRQSKVDGETWLSGKSVTLVPEPGVDLDRYQRLLRYVLINGSMDYGKIIVGYGHTKVYAGRNDASPAYVATLRELDALGDPYSCAGPPAPDTQYVPVPGGGDDDDKSRYCRRHWYC